MNGETRPKQRGRPRKSSSDIASPEKDTHLRVVRERLSTAYGYAPDQIRSLDAGAAPWDAIVVTPTGEPLSVIRLTDKFSDVETWLNDVCASPENPKLAIWSNGIDYRYYARTTATVWRRIVDFPENGYSAGKETKLRKSHLKVPETLINEFGSIRAHVAGNTVGVTRDEAIVRDVVKILFCKIHDETAPDEFAQFFAAPMESEVEVAARIKGIYKNLVDHVGIDVLPDFFVTHADFALDADALAFAASTLQHFNLSAARRDVVGEAFQALIGPSLRGEEGQFFTPKNLVEMAVRLVNPKAGERVIDPACGAGGFLVEVAAHIAKHRPAAEVTNKVDNKTLLVGIDKDGFLSSVAQAYFSLLRYAQAHVFCADALKPPSSWRDAMLKTIELGTFDVVITNPPFGAKIPVRGEATLAQYRLASVWKRGTHGKGLHECQFRADARPPQILFIERCLQLLKPGGRMAIILPDGILGNVSDAYVRQLVSELADVVAVVDCPLETFLPSTPTKTSVLILRKKSSSIFVPRAVFMAVAKHCGHDRRAKPLFRDDGTTKDDFPEIAAAFEIWNKRHDAGF